MRKYSAIQYGKDRRIIEYIEGNSINIDNYEKDIELKKRLLSEVCGHKNLRVSSNLAENPFLPIDECKPTRISEVTRKIYENALERIKDYEAEHGSEERSIKESMVELEKRVEAERKQKQDGQLELGLGFAFTRHGHPFLNPKKIHYL